MKGKKENGVDRLIWGFTLMGFTVIEMLILGAIFGIQETLAPIWSDAGLAILHILGLSLLAIHLLLHRQEIKECKVIITHIISFILSWVMIYMIILLSSVICSVRDINTAVEPLWGDTGAILSYWVAAMGWCSGYLYRAILKLT